MPSSEELRNLLNRIDHKSYPAYKDTKGRYEFQGYHLSIDHVQGDPFASPSGISIRIKGSTAGFPPEYYRSKWRRIALQDYLLRHFSGEVEKVSHQAKGSGKSGVINISRCRQEILERSACQIEGKSGDITVRLEVGFPANGRTINSRELIKIFFDLLPQCVKRSLHYEALCKEEVEETIHLSDDREFIKEQLAPLGLTAFVANGSVLPRESGISGCPMKEAVKFRSPKSMEVTLELPHHGTIKGMGIKKGITLIVGGGYHGKSTLLKALELGIYPHIIGDGREYVVTEETAVKIRAEDGRSIQHVDISMFIKNLPNKKDTISFVTEDASGSTSQAANVIEAMEAGAFTLLIDEDTSATNFMIRDELMQRVVAKEAEPITPFIDRVQNLYEEFGISTILVAGSSGSYFHKADCILQMKEYEPYEITDIAKKEAQHFPIPKAEAAAADKPNFERFVQKNNGVQQKDRVKIKALGMDGVSLNREIIDLRYVEQLADPEQLAALGYLVNYAQKHVFHGNVSLRDGVAALMQIMEDKGIEAVCESSYLPSSLAVPRKQEIFACINRYRGLSMKEGSK